MACAFTTWGTQFQKSDGLDLYPSYHNTWIQNIQTLYVQHSTSQLKLLLYRNDWLLYYVCIVCFPIPVLPVYGGWHKANWYHSLGLRPICLWGCRVHNIDGFQAMFPWEAEFWARSCGVAMRAKNRICRKIDTPTLLWQKELNFISIYVCIFCARLPLKWDLKYELCFLITEVSKTYFCGNIL